VSNVDFNSVVMENIYSPHAHTCIPAPLPSAAPLPPTMPNDHPTRERTESSCSGYGSCSSNSHNHCRRKNGRQQQAPRSGGSAHQQAPRSGNGGGGRQEAGSRRNQQQAPKCGGSASGGLPEMTMIVHRIDLFDDFVPSRSGPCEELVLVRCLGVEGGCAW
jgi:hypothetical protein